MSDDSEFTPPPPTEPHPSELTATAPAAATKKRSRPARTSDGGGGTTNKSSKGRRRAAPVDPIAEFKSAQALPPPDADGHDFYHGDICSVVAALNKQTAALQQLLVLLEADRATPSGGGGTAAKKGTRGTKKLKSAATPEDRLEEARGHLQWLNTKTPDEFEALRDAWLGTHGLNATPVIPTADMEGFTLEHFLEKWGPRATEGFAVFLAAKNAGVPVAGLLSATTKRVSTPNGGWEFHPVTPSPDDRPMVYVGQKAPHSSETSPFAKSWARRKPAAAVHAATTNTKVTEPAVAPIESPQPLDNQPIAAETTDNAE